MGHALNIGDLVAQLLNRMPACEILEAMIEGQISSAIRIFREEMHMDRAQFAKKLGVTRRKIAKWEDGAHNFSVKELCVISCGLGLELTCCFGNKNK